MKTKKVNLLGPIDMDKITIRKDHYFSNAYIIDLPLDSIPDHVWQDIFEQKWGSSRHLWDRKLFVIGDKLRLITTAHNIENKLDWVKQIIEQTNEGVEKYNREIEARRTQLKEELRKATEEEKATVERIKDILKKKFGVVVER